MSEWSPSLSPPAFERRERRYKLLRVSAEDVLQCLFPRTAGDFLYLRSAAGIPPDVEVVSVHGPDIDYYPPMFTFLIFHPSFPVVENGGSIPPNEPVFIKYVRLERKPDVDGYEAYAVSEADTPTIAGAAPAIVEGGKP